jgi:hypothetical protein
LFVGFVTCNRHIEQGDTDMNVGAHRRFELLARALLAASSLAGVPNTEQGTDFRNEDYYGVRLMAEAAPGQER